MKKLIATLIFLVISAIAPLSLYAQAPQPVGNANVQPVGNANVQPVGNQPAPVTAQGRLENPLRGANSIGELFNTLAQFVIDLAYVVIAAFLLLSGFKFIKAQGNPEELATAKRTFWYTIIGAMIIIGMDTMIAVFKNILEQLGTR